MTDSYLRRHGSQPRVGRPQRHAGDERGRDEVCIDPTDAATAQLPAANELDHLVVRDGRRLVHQGVVSEELQATTPVADHIATGAPPTGGVGRHRPDHTTASWHAVCRSHP